MMNLLLTDAARRTDDQDADEESFSSRCGRLIDECKKLQGITSVHFPEDDEPKYLYLYTDDGVDENSLRHVIAEIAETLEIMVDRGAG